MDALRERFAAAVDETIAEHDLPWSLISLGARAEYRFDAPAPRTGAESVAAADTELEEYLHLFLLNRGVLITPFHNMALMCPATTEDQVDRHSRAFADTPRARLSGKNSCPSGVVPARNRPGCSQERPSARHRFR